MPAYTFSFNAAAIQLSEVEDSVEIDAHPELKAEVISLRRKVEKAANIRRQLRVAIFNDPYFREIEKVVKTMNPADKVTKEGIFNVCLLLAETSMTKEDRHAIRAARKA